jgi:hypothetical protein
MILTISRLVSCQGILGKNSEQYTVSEIMPLPQEPLTGMLISLIIAAAAAAAAAFTVTRP